MKRWLTASLALAAAPLLVACVPYAASSGIDGELFQPLQRRDLPALEQQIAVRRHGNFDDGWTAVAAGWLALASCEAIPVTPEGGFAQDEAIPEFVWSSLHAEDARRRMLVAQLAATGERPGETQFRYIHTDSFFVREAAAIDEELIRWPAEEEAWLDEVPAAVDAPSSCGDFPQRALLDADSEPVTYEDTVQAYLAAVEVVEKAYSEIDPAARSGSIEALRWRTNFYAAQVQHQVGAAWASFAVRAEEAARAGRDAAANRDKAADATERADELARSARERLAKLVDSAPPSVEPEEVGRARLLYATYALREGRTALALSLLSSVRELAMTDDDFWTARYLELRVASDAARWSEAASLADGLPPRTSALHGPYYYRVAVALKRTGAEDRFLQVAMKAFRDAPYKSDPFLRALYHEMLQTLAEYPFEPRIVEMLEEMGQRVGTFERLEEYARVALDRGRAENADAAAVYLLAQHHDAKFHPQYQAIRALAAFLDDDPRRFRDRVTDVVRRPAAVLNAVPQTRRATFFAHSDAELARILRQILPLMAEWGDGDAARQRRGRWLEIIVDETQEFLRESDDTLARPQLLELYRLASGLLADHPRGYAERVGEQEPAPLVLGTVRVERRDLERFEPRAIVTLPEPFSLTLLPDPDLPPTQWPFFWPRIDDLEGE